MSGGYIQCGDFMGADKSGSAFSGVIDALVDLIPVADRPAFSRSVIDPIREALSGGEDYILIEPAIAEQITPVLEAFYSNLGEELGSPDPWDVPLRDEADGLDPTEAKWGKGRGWQYYCAYDMLQACRVSVEFGQPICVHFD